MSSLIRRPLGVTGLSVSPLALGAGHIGGEIDDREVEALLDEALDLGVNLIDTAPSYGASEERIGRFLGRRRDEFILSTKGGYGVAGIADWSGAVITAGIEQALRLLRTDRIDVFHLHSCPLPVLVRDDLLAALEAARQQGKIISCAYSGEGDALSWAIQSGRFGVVQASVNLFDQRGLHGAVAQAAQRGIGVLAKRALGNAPWRFADRPVGHYAETYWTRMRQMSQQPESSWTETALRFCAYAGGVSSALVGTTSVDHLRQAAAAIALGPLAATEQQRWRAAFEQNDRDWLGQI